MELILAGLPDNYRMETIYETKQVQVGSHQEDHGHNETYVDYEYCDLRCPPLIATVHTTVMPDPSRGTA